MNNDATVPPELAEAAHRDAGDGAGRRRRVPEDPPRRHVPRADASRRRRRRLRPRRPARASACASPACGSATRTAGGGTRFASGTWGPEVDADGTDLQWTRGAARGARRRRDATATIVRAAPRRAGADARSPSRAVTTARPSPSAPSPQWYPVPFAGERIDVVNNVGTHLVADGYAADRGWLERDAGQYERDEDVFAWCGAAVLLRADYLREVGAFDERLFLYSEDVELAWRGLQHGLAAPARPRVRRPPRALGHLGAPRPDRDAEGAQPAARPAPPRDARRLVARALLRYVPRDRLLRPAATSPRRCSPGSRRRAGWSGPGWLRWSDSAAWRRRCWPHDAGTGPSVPIRFARLKGVRPRADSSTEAPPGARDTGEPRPPRNSNGHG